MDSGLLITSFADLKKGYKSQCLMALYYNTEKRRLFGKTYIRFSECKNYLEPRATLEYHKEHAATLINIGGNPEIHYTQEYFGPLPNYMAYFFNTSKDGSKLVTVCKDGMLRSNFNSVKASKLLELCREGTVSPHQAHILSLI